MSSSVGGGGDASSVSAYKLRRVLCRERVKESAEARLVDREVAVRLVEDEWRGRVLMLCLDLTLVDEVAEQPDEGVRMTAELGLDDCPELAVRLKATEVRRVVDLCFCRRRSFLTPLAKVVP